MCPSPAPAAACAARALPSYGQTLRTDTTLGNGLTGLSRALASGAPVQLMVTCVSWLHMAWERTSTCTLQDVASSAYGFRIPRFLCALVSYVRNFGRDTLLSVSLALTSESDESPNSIKSRMNPYVVGLSHRTALRGHGLSRRGGGGL